MAVKKSELYSLLWEACNKLRGGVEPARYKDYVLVLLFFKYVSDRYKGERRSEFTIKQGASFDELIDAKYTPDVAETVDTILQKFLEDNGLSGSLPDVSFNNPDELGTGKELVDKVSGLIAVFENPAIDFRSNRASGDDIIGDAYEYFMMKFAQESGKSKGQFYTPSEVSRIIARLIGIGDIKPSLTKKWTLYDPAAGSGSLLIRAADEAPTDASGKSIVSIFGQEKDHATAGLAKMNFILHQKGTGEIVKGNTLSSPGYLDEFDQLRKFDFIVMNPPFSDKSWSDGIKTSDDKYKRFDGYGIPPEKNGDYAWFLHVLKSLNPDGKAGIILPHGVLFRGNTEETIRIEILNKKYIKGIVSLPANLFYGTGIPACIVIIDKENADSREGIFLIDASQDFKKDGNKNRLREQDIERIVQTFLNQVEIPGYSRFVRYEDVVKKNGGNLNVPRYIQKIDAALPQNIAAHLRGGIPRTDIESIDKLWRISPALKEKIFTCTDPKQGIYQLALSSANLEKTVVDDDVVRRELSHETDALFNEWKESVKGALLGINLKTVPRDFIRSISLKLLEKFKNSKILDAYDVYDCLLNYWVAKLQDDVYAIKAGGYEVGREIDFEYAQKKAKDKTGHAITVDDKSKEKSFDGALIPKEIIEQEYFVDDLKKIQMFTEEAEAINVQMEELREEESGEEGLLREVLNDKGDNIPKANLTKRLKEIKDKGTDKNEDGDEYTCLTRYKGLMDKRDADLKKSKDARNALDKKLKDKYGELTVEEIKELLFEKKWMAKIVADINAVAAQVLNDLSSTVLLIAKRYEHTLGEIEKSTAESRVEVMAALERMGYKW